MPVLPRGIEKSNTAAPDVPVLVIAALLPAVPVVTVPTAIVAADPVAPVEPMEPVAPIGPVGPVGPPGPTQPLFYTHTQATPSASWVINHNLNGYPTVVVFDSAGTQCEGSFSYTSLNQMVITYSSAFSGLAYVI